MVRPKIKLDISLSELNNQNIKLNKIEKVQGVVRLKSSMKI